MGKVVSHRNVWGKASFSMHSYGEVRGYPKYRKSYEIRVLNVQDRLWGLNRDRRIHFGEDPFEKNRKVVSNFHSNSSERMLKESGPGMLFMA